MSIKMNFFVLVFVFIFSLNLCASTQNLALVTAEGDIFSVGLTDGKPTAVANLNDKLKGSELLKAGKFIVLETKFDYRNNVLYSVVRNGAISGVLAFNVESLGEPKFYAGVSQVIVFKEPEAPTVFVSTEPFTVGQEFEQRSYDRARLQQLNRSGKSAPLTDWQTAGTLFVPLDRCFFTSIANMLNKESVSVLDVFPKGYAVVGSQKKEDLATYVYTRVGCWNGSSVLVSKYFLNPPNESKSFSYLQRRNQSGYGGAEIAYQKIAWNAIDSCVPAGFEPRFAFCFGSSFSGDFTAVVYDFDKKLVTTRKVSDAQSATNTVPYLLGSSADGMTWYFTQGHPTGLHEGFAKTLLELRIGDTSVLSAVSLHNDEIERIRGAFQLPIRK